MSTRLTLPARKRTILAWLAAVVLATGAMAEENQPPATPATPANYSAPTFAPWNAVTYREWPEAGPQELTGRKLSPWSQSLYGIDVNSRVTIDFDSELLARDLASVTNPKVDRCVAKRMDKLTGAVRALGEITGSLDPIITSMNQNLTLLQQPEGTHLSDKEKEAQDKGKVSALAAIQGSLTSMQVKLTSSTGRFLDTLRAVIASRLECSGVAAEDAKEVSEKKVGSVNPNDGGSWEAAGALLRDEMTSVAGAVAAAPRSVPYKLKIDAVLLHGDGGKSDIHLPGYNQAAAGIVHAVDKVGGVPDGAGTASSDANAAKNRAKESFSDTITAVAALQVQPTSLKARARLTPVLGRVSAMQQELTAIGELLASLPDLPKPKSPAVTLELQPTSFDLRTIPAKRSVGDIVLLTYSFVPVAGAGGSDGTKAAKSQESGAQEKLPTWEDRFQIRSFGWHAEANGGVAFVRQRGKKTWQPVPLASFILDYQRWSKQPTTDPTTWQRDAGLRNLANHDWFSGFGLALMTLDFDDKKDFEVGLGAVVSFLHNRIQLGHGWNLQVQGKEHKGDYWFFTVNVFDGQKLFKKVQDQVK